MSEESKNAEKKERQFFKYDYKPMAKAPSGAYVKPIGKIPEKPSKPLGAVWVDMSDIPNEVRQFHITKLNAEKRGAKTKAERQDYDDRIEAARTAEVDYDACFAWLMKKLDAWAPTAQAGTWHFFNAPEVYKTYFIPAGFTSTHPIAIDKVENGIRGDLKTIIAFARGRVVSLLTGEVNKAIEALKTPTGSLVTITVSIDLGLAEPDVHSFSGVIRAGRMEKL